LLCGAGIDCRTRASIESGDVVSRVKRQARDLAGAMRFSLALRTSCIRSFLMHQNLKRSGATFLRAMTIHRLDRLTASAGSAEKSMLVCMCVCVCAGDLGEVMIFVCIKSGKLLLLRSYYASSIFNN
jgi:hypothetical protein